MNAPFRDLLASHSLFANSEWDERRVIIDLMWIFSNHALYNVIQFYKTLGFQIFAGIFFVDFGNHFLFLESGALYPHILGLHLPSVHSIPLTSRYLSQY